MSAGRRPTSVMWWTPWLWIFLTESRSFRLGHGQRRLANIIPFGRCRHHPERDRGKRMTGWQIAKRILLLLVTALSLYLLAPKVISVLASWPQLKTLKPGWLALAVLFEVMSYLSLWTMQRVALHATSWFAVGTSQLASGAIGSIVPGGAATAGAVGIGC